MLWLGMPKAMRRWAENDDEKDYRKKARDGDAARRVQQATTSETVTPIGKSNVLNIFFFCSCSFDAFRMHARNVREKCVCVSAKAKYQPHRPTTYRWNVAKQEN